MSLCTFTTLWKKFKIRRKLLNKIKIIQEISKDEKLTCVFCNLAHHLSN